MILHTLNHGIRCARGVLALVAAGLMFAFASPASALPKTIYVNGDLWTGAPTGDGSMASPYSDFGSAAKALRDNDEILVAGLITPANGYNEEIRNHDGFVIRQWPSQSPAIFDGGIDIPSVEFVEATPGVRYTASLPAGLSLTTVTEGYARISENDPRYKGHLRPVKSIASVEATECSWFYEKSTGQLHVHPLNGESPAISGRPFAYTVPGDGIRLINCHSWRVSSLEFRRICDNTASEGYGVNVITATNATIDNVRVYDGGAHSLGFTGHANDNNRITNCEVWGLHGGRDSQIQIVFYSQGTDLENNVCADTTFHLYGSLDPRGESINPGRAIIGAFQHQGYGVEIKPQGLIWRRCTFVGYDGHDSIVWVGSSNNLKPASSPLNKDEHRIIIEDCVATNCTSLRLNSNGANVFVDRCFFELTRRNSPEATGTANGAAGAVIIGSRDEVTSTTIRSTVIIADAPTSTAGSAAIALFGKARLTMTLSTVYIDGAPSVPIVSVGGPGTASLHSGQNLWARSTVGPFAGYTSGGNLAFESLHSSIFVNSPTAQSPALPEFSDVEVIGAADDLQYLMPTPAPPLRTLEDIEDLPGALYSNMWQPQDGILGINGRLYSGRFGAVQDGHYPCPADINGDLLVDAMDLNFLLAAWGTLGGPADLGGGPEIDATDLAAMLSAWGPCP